MNRTLRPYRHRTPPPQITPTWVRTETVNIEQGIPGSVAAAFWPYAIQPGETGVVDQSFPFGCFERYGAKADGSDDSLAWQRAMNSAQGARVFGVPGHTYTLAQQLMPPSTLDFDFTGITIRPTTNVDLFKRVAQPITVSSVVTGGATLGSATITVVSSVGFAVNDLVIFTTTYAVTMPWSWSRVKTIVGNTITLYSPLTFTYAGTVTLSVKPLYGQIRMYGGRFDLGAIGGAPGALINLAGYDLVWTKNLGFYGPMTTNNVIAGVTIEGCRRGYNEDSEAIDVIMQATPFAVHQAERGRNSRIDIDGDCFGTICVACDSDVQEDIRYRGQRQSGSANSIRAVKVSSGRHSVVTNVYASDCETVVELFNCGRVQGTNINGTDIGLTTYSGQTAINIAGSLSDGFQQHIQLTTVNLERLGAIGIQTSGDITGRISLTDVHVKDCGADGMVLNTIDTQVEGAQIENWNTDSHSGSAGIRQTATGGNSVNDFAGVIFRHTDATKKCMNLAAGPRNYLLRGVASPTGNPLFDTVNGIDPGAQNLSVGAVGSLTLGPSVSKVSQLGTTAPTFTLPINTAMTFTFEGSAVSWVISVDNGRGGRFFCEKHSSTININDDPSSFFVNSGAPASGTMGVSKSADANVVTITNNPTDGAFVIAIQTFGGRITATTDPV